MRVLITGGGIGGLTAALAFTRIGHQAIVFEQSPLNEEVGAGIQISPNGMRVFEALGVSAQIEKDAFRPRAQELRFGRSGRIIASVPLREAAKTRWGAEYIHLHRADLVEALSSALQDRSDDALKRGARVKSYAQRSGSVAVELDDGQWIEGDLLVGADGIHSVVRKTMLGEDRPRFTGHVAWRAIAPVSELGDLAPPETACVWVGAGRHAVTYRLRRGSLANLVGVVQCKEAEIESWTATGARQHAMQDFQRWSPGILRILEKATTLNRWALYDRSPLSTWTQGRAVLIGDACHPMLPFLAQGAVMAIEDAYVLAQLVGSGRDVEEALQRFELLRKPRTSRVQAHARKNASLFHHGNPLSQAIVYGPIWLAGLLAPSVVHGQYDWIYSYDVASPELYDH